MDESGSQFSRWRALCLTVALHACGVDRAREGTPCFKIRKGYFFAPYCRESAMIRTYMKAACITLLLMSAIVLGACESTAQTCVDGDQKSCTCGNGVLDPGEGCDDGNTANGDGCNIRCNVEPSVPLADSEPVGYSPSPLNIPVDYSACSDENKNQAFAPGAQLTISACAIRYVDLSGNGGVTQGAIQDEFTQAQAFYDAAGANIAIRLIHTDTFMVSGTGTDPTGDVELQALHVATRQRADEAHPRECDVVVGYTNTLWKDTGAIGGQATIPSSDLRECLVARSNVGTGQSTAHELGHVFGLFHTFETSYGDGDGCRDTPVDSSCALAGGCDVSCAPAALSHNVMSYYGCTTPHADDFSACQVRRARCFVTKIFSDVCGDAGYCNGHGSCSNGVCTCNAGFSGSQCDSCATGYIGYPNCEQNCPANYCNMHGSCANNICTCNLGFSGSQCNACATGYSMYPNCAQNCPANYCNMHGSCNNNNCTCNLGYTGTKCDTCSAGYTGYPACVPICTPNCPACRISNVSNGCGGMCAANCSTSCYGGTCTTPQPIQLPSLTVLADTLVGGDCDLWSTNTLTLQITLSRTASSVTAFGSMSAVEYPGDPGATRGTGTSSVSVNQSNSQILGTTTFQTSIISASKSALYPPVSGFVKSVECYGDHYGYDICSAACGVPHVYPTCTGCQVTFNPITVLAP